MANRRAVVLVHGWGRFKRRERLDRLVRALERNAPMPVRPAVDGAIEGESYRRLVPDDDRTPDRPDVDVFEAHWSDMIPADAEKSPVRRFLDASTLVLYWLVNPWWLQALRINRSLTAALMLSGALLLVWYVVVIVALADFVQPPAAVETGAAAPASVAPSATPVVPDGGGAEGVDPLDRLAAWLAPVLAPFAGLSSRQWFVALLALLSVLPVSTLTDLAAFVRRYHASGVVEGFDSEVTGRVHAVLRRVYARRDPDDPTRPFYGEVVVVGHSMGGVIALEALAPWGHPAVPERTTLITWGSPIAILSLRDPDRLGRRVAAACGGALPRWIDVHSATDWLSAPVPAHAAAFPGATLTPRFPVSWWTGLTEAHDQYFHHDDVLAMLVAPLPAAIAAGAD